MKRIVNCFLEVAQRHADAIEHVLNRRVTYAQLAEEIQTFADSLKSVDGDIVAVQLPRSIDFVVALFGVWLANKTALILDPEWPVARVRSSLECFDASALVDADGLHQIADLGSSQSLLGCDAAYIILTSGTTGAPKGTIVGHAGIWNVLNAQIEAFLLNDASRSYWMHGVAFDASISDVGTVLLSGGTLVIDREIRYEKLCERWRHLEISHVDLPPALLPHIELGSAPVCLKVIIVGGQIADIDSVRKWSEQRRVVNVYGPTEATICSSLVVCETHWSHALIGNPVDGITYTIDPSSGELLISGVGVAWGYYGQPELSSARFSCQSGIRTFHTRDQVRRLEDGSIEFVGRLDRQFKLHGKLICPEEIENVINSVTGVSQSVVQKHPERSHLVACVETEVVKQAQILDHLKRSLPQWMIPSEWLLLRTLPMSTNGKVDVGGVSQLLSAHAAMMTVKEAVALSETERKLCAIFQAAMGQPLSELQTPFDQLGIDSMLVIQVLIEAEKAGLSLSTQSLKRWATIRTLAKSIDDGLLIDEGRSARELLAHIQPLIPPSKFTHSDFCMPSHILITGATGFFGSALLGILLQQAPEVRFTCLVRGGDQQRVLDALARHGYRDNADFECIEGDVALERFGLSVSDWSRLAAQVDTVVHSAAKVNLVESFESCFSANVLGTANVLKFCDLGQPKLLHFISTLSVFVDAWPLPELCLETDALESTETVYGGYAQSKWAAEYLVRESMLDGSVSIYRLGLLTANSVNGYAPANDLFSGFMRDHSFDRVAGRGQQCDYTPVDTAAEKASTLILNRSVGTWHLCNPTQMTYERLQQTSIRSDVTRTLAGISHLALADGHSPFRIFKTTNTKFSVQYTEQALLKRRNHE